MARKPRKSRAKYSPEERKARRAEVLADNVSRLSRADLTRRSRKGAATRRKTKPPTTRRAQRRLATFGDRANSPDERADLAFQAIDPNMGFLPPDFYDRIQAAGQTTLSLRVANMDADGNVEEATRIRVEIPEGTEPNDIKRLIWAAMRTFVKEGGGSGEYEKGSALLIYAADFADY